jgi:hypothetical protein
MQISGFACLRVAIICCATFSACAVPSPAGNIRDPIKLQTTSLVFSRLPIAGETFGKLRFRGGLVLSSPESRFGGFSGLAVSADGKRLMAVSDEGWWLQADIEYNGARLSALANAAMAPLLDRAGNRARSKQRRDAEALAVEPAGEMNASVYVGFERRTRIEKFNMRSKGLAARPVRISIPDSLAAGPDNAELEALGRLESGPFKGSLLAISEKNLDGAGNVRAWIINGSKSISFAIARNENYDITDLAVLPDGNILTLERSYSPGTLVGMAVRKFSLSGVKADTTIFPDLLFRGRQPFYRIDNMEGIAAHKVGQEQRITIISDDNYNHGVQQTVLFQFALMP